MHSISKTRLAQINTGSQGCFFNLEMERAVLGTLISDLPDAQDRLLPLLKTDTFYSDRHKMIFESIQTLKSKGRPVDLLNVTDLLNGKIDRDYLLDIAEACAPVCHAEDYIQTLKSLAHKRAIEVFYHRLPQLNGDLAEAVESLLVTIKDTGQKEKKPILFNAGDILGMDNNLVWLVEGVLPKGAVIMISGRPGVGKTWFALLLAKAVSEGLPFLGRGSRKAKVAYIDLENPASVLKDRLGRIRPAEDLRFAPGWAMEKPFDLWDRDLDVLAKEYGLVVIDSLVRSHNYKENEASEMAKVMSRLRQLANRGATVFFLHHKGKGQDNEYRGSSDILAGVDIGYLLDSKDGHLELKTLKSRMAEDFKIPLSLTIDPNGVELRDQTQELEAQRIDKEGKQLETLAGVIRDLSTDREHPNQKQVTDAVKEEMDIGKDAVLKLLKKGEGRYWEKVKDPNDSRGRLYKITEKAL